MKTHTRLCAAVFLAVVAWSSSQAQETAPAVDGVNVKLSASTGLTDSNITGLAGALSLPLGSSFGLQIDGVYSEFDSNSKAGHASVFGTAAHLFWRNPEQGLIGAAAQYIRLDEIGGTDAYIAAAEGALYRGQFTLEGAAGYIDGDVSSSFFDDIQVAYYPTDDLKLHVGHAYVIESNYLTYGVEWGIPSRRNTATSLFIQGDLAEGGSHQASAGLRLYFGQKPKSLIERHRQDDPLGLTPQNAIRVQSAIAKVSCALGINPNPAVLPICVPTN